MADNRIFSREKYAYISFLSYLLMSFSRPVRLWRESLNGNIRFPGSWEKISPKPVFSPTHRPASGSTSRYTFRKGTDYPELNPTANIHVSFITASEKLYCCNKNHATIPIPEGFHSLRWCYEIPPGLEIIMN